MHHEQVEVVNLRDNVGFNVKINFSEFIYPFSVHFTYFFIPFEPSAYSLPHTSSARDAYVVLKFVRQLLYFIKMKVKCDIQKIVSYLYIEDEQASRNKKLL